MSRRGPLLLGVLAATVVASTAVAVGILNREPPAEPQVATAPVGWAGPVRGGGADDAVDMMRAGADQALAWSEAPDVAPAWADVSRIAIPPDGANWLLELADFPPAREALARAGQVLGFGFVMDTTGDGVADYEVGIDTDAEAPAVHVWLTDLATGETTERFSGPYGDPFDFGTILESQGERDPDEQGGVAGGLFFNIGAAPPELFDHENTRFYAWSSLTENGEVVAWDYAPDAGWLAAPPRERLGCDALACPMAGPEPGPGAREWIVSVENQSPRDAHLFVASDTMPMGELVGTAVPASVPAGTTERVVLTVPSGTGWAIFVNPSPTDGPLILARDVPLNASGVLPLTIFLQPSGMAVVSAPPAPGWFGN